MRVLAVHPYADLYGSDRMFVRSVVALREAGHEVAVVLGDDGPLHERLAGEGVPAQIVRVPVLRKALLNPRGVARLVGTTPAVIARLHAVVREHDPDVLYLNTVTAPQWVAAARLAGVPVVAHVRELESDASRVVVRAMLAPLLGTQAVVANSRATADHLSRQWPALAGRTRVVHNGLAFPEDVPAPPTLSGSITMTVVGRLSPRKGQQVALEALRLLVTGGCDARLRLVGSVFPGYEWFEESLRADAAAGLADRVELLGYTDDVTPAYVAADVVLVPSLLEPFGSVAAEALALARPVVVTDVGGLPEIVRDGETGLVVPRDDARALADAVSSLLRDPARARAMAVAGAADVRARFGEDRYGRELVAAVTATAPAGRAPSRP